jgi:hypothetical protein
MQSKSVNALAGCEFPMVVCDNKIRLAKRSNKLNAEVLFTPKTQNYAFSLGLLTNDGKWSLNYSGEKYIAKFAPKTGDNLKAEVSADIAGTTIFGCSLNQKVCILGTEFEVSGSMKDRVTELEYKVHKRFGKNVLSFGFCKDIYLNYTHNFSRAVCSVGFNGNTASATLEVLINGFKGSFALLSKDFAYDNFKSTLSYRNPNMLLSAKYDYKDSSLTLGARREYKKFSFSLMEFYQVQSKPINIVRQDEEEDVIVVNKISKFSRGILTYKPHERYSLLFGLHHEDHEFSQLVGVKALLPSNLAVIGAIERKQGQYIYTLSVDLNQ